MSTTTVFIGIDLGRATSAGIVRIENKKPILVDSIKTDLGRGEAEKASSDKKLAYRIDRLYSFLENLLGTYPDYALGVERPPQMKGKIAIGHLQAYYGVALLMARRSDKRFSTMAVPTWKSIVGAGVSFGSPTKASVRQKIVKQRSLDVILSLLGKDYGKDHDRADSLGIAIATAVKHGGLVL